MKFNKTILSVSLLSLFANANVTDDVKNLQADWAIANYQTQESNKESAFQNLIAKSKNLSENNPNSAEILTWEGIILSTYAGVAPGLSGLDYVKQAKEKL